MAELSPLQRALRVLQLLSVREHITVNELYEYFQRRETVRTLRARWKASNRPALAFFAAKARMASTRSASFAAFSSFRSC